MTHHLKCDSTPFYDIWNGHKRAEFRLDDRGFSVGDILVLSSQVRHLITGEIVVFKSPIARCNKPATITCKVTHIQTGYGIPEGYVMMSIKVMSKSHG